MMVELYRVLSNGVPAVLNIRVLRVRWTATLMSRNMPEARSETAVGCCSVASKE
jgi:hypothetical protein